MVENDHEHEIRFTTTRTTGEHAHVHQRTLRNVWDAAGARSAVVKSHEYAASTAGPTLRANDGSALPSAHQLGLIVLAMALDNPQIFLSKDGAPLFLLRALAPACRAAQPLSP